MAHRAELFNHTYKQECALKGALRRALEFYCIIRRRMQTGCDKM
jgi:hypothetical protein